MVVCCLSEVDFEVTRCRPLKEAGLFNSEILQFLSLGPSPDGADPGMDLSDGPCDRDGEQPKFPSGSPRWDRLREHRHFPSSFGL